VSGGAPDVRRGLVRQAQPRHLAATFTRGACWLTMWRFDSICKTFEACM